MIALYSTDGKTRLAITYNGLTLNNPSDSNVSLYEVTRVVTAETYGTVTEEDPDDDGMESYKVRKVSRIIRMDGYIRAQTPAALYDKMKAFNAAFDPAKVFHDNQSTYGFLPLDFSVPTADTTNYPSGLVASRYYARASKSVVPPDSKDFGYVAPFSVELICADPRRYLQSTTTFNGAGALDNSLADYRSWPTVTITMSGAGSATYSLARAHSLGTKTLVLNLSGCVNTDVVVVDMYRRKITKNGTETPSLYVSGNFWEVEVGTNTLTITNGTNATTSTVWRRAFSA